MAYKVLKCTCKSEFQDKEYGTGMRLHNGCGKDGKSNEYRCTICGNKKSAK